MIGRLVPVILFVLLGILLAAGLKIADHKTEIPSPLIGKPLPPFELPERYAIRSTRVLTAAGLLEPIAHPSHQTLKQRQPPNGCLCFSI